MEDFSETYTIEVWVNGYWTIIRTSKSLNDITIAFRSIVSNSDGRYRLQTPDN